MIGPMASVTCKLLVVKAYIR